MIGKHNQIVFLNEAGKDAGTTKEEADDVDKRKQRAKRFGLVGDALSAKAPLKLPIALCLNSGLCLVHHPNLTDVDGVSV